MAMSQHGKGLAIGLIGIIALSPEALLIRLVSVDHWTIVVWRGALLCIGLLVASTLTARSWRVVPAIGSAGLLVALLFGLQTVGFVFSITTTTVANTLIAMSAAPLFAALLEAALFKDHISARLWTVIAVAMFGIILMFSGSVGSGALQGDLAGLATAAALGTALVIIRRNKDRTMVPAMALGGLVASLLALPFSEPASVTSTDIRYLAISGLVVLPMGFGLLAVAPRYILAPEVGLITLLETILGPLWVWLVLAEQPDRSTIVGGGVVILALTLNSYLGIRETSRVVPTEPRVA